MKNLGLLSLPTAIILHGILFVGTVCSSVAQVRWVQEYSDTTFGSRDLLHAGIQTSDGQMYFAATTEELIQDKLAHLLKYSAGLHLEWDAVLKGDPEQIPTGHFSICYDSIGYAIYLLGSYQEHIEENLIGEKSVLVKFDSSGNQLWTKQVGLDYAVANALAVDSSGNCIVGLSVYHPRIDTFSRKWLIKIGPDSHTIWEKEVGTLFGVRAIGQISRILCTPGDPEYRVFVKDDDRILWLKVNPDSGVPTLMGIKNGVHTIYTGQKIYADRRQIVWACSRKVQVFGNYRLEIQKIDLNDTSKNWTAVMVSDGQDAFVQDLHAGPDIITAIGYTQKTSGEKSAFVFQTSLTGFGQNFREINFSDASDIPLRITSNRDGGYLIAGFSETKPYSTNFFCRIGPSLEVLWVSKEPNDEKIETRNFEIWLHPHDDYIIVPGEDLIYDRKEMPVFPFKYDLFLTQRNLETGEYIEKVTYSGKGNGNFGQRWLRTDSEGFVYVAGFRNLGWVLSGVPFTRDIPDLFLLKYDRNGNLIWSTIYEPEEHNESLLLPSFFNLDKKENPVVVFNEIYKKNDTRVVQYNKNGQVIWTLKIDMPDTLYQAPILSFGVSPKNDYLVQLYEQSELSLIKINEDGQIVWRRTMAVPHIACEGFHTLHQTLFDPEGNIIVSYGANSCVNEMFIEKRNLFGDLIWKIRTNLGVIKVDGEGNIFCQNQSMLTKFHNQTGAEMWAKAIPDCQYCNILGINSGNVFLAGYNKVLKFNSAGELIKETTFQFPFWQFLMKADHIVLVSREFEGLVFNLEGDFVDSLKCSNCPIYQFFPAILSTVGGLPFSNPGCLDIYKDFLFVGGDIARGSFRTLGFNGGLSHVYTVSFQLPSSNPTEAIQPSDGFDVKIFPNPSSTGAFTVVLSGHEQEITEIFISDPLGRRLLKQAYPSGSSLDFYIPLPGLYFVHAKTSQGTLFTKKIVIGKQ